MIKFFKKLFEKENTSMAVKEIAIEREESLIHVEGPREIAKVIPLSNPELEFHDLNDRHEDFFEPNSSALKQMQSRIGQQPPNIEDVTPSRSDKFFQEAPSFTIKKEEYPDFSEETEEILAIENYVGVGNDEIHEEIEEEFRQLS